MTINRLHSLHERRFEANRFVYPVISRRSAGLSIGINLNPDKVCNFDCIYCQVDRTTESDTRFVQLDEMLGELDHMLELAAGGEIFNIDKFSRTPAELRRLNDMAFSGDGEPTTHTNFDEVVAACAELKAKHGLDETRMVLITNASMFHRQHVQQGLKILDANNGQVWAKLEAGTDAYYRLVERTKIPFQRILDNILSAAQVRPLIIQSLFLRINGEPPTDEELEAFCQRLNDIQRQGGQLDHVQVYTVARRPAESYVTALTDREVDQIVELVRRRTKLDARAYYGVIDP